MRALIVRQPWAGLFAAGLKRNAAGEIVEFRNRQTHIRERVAVYAGARSQIWQAKTDFWYALSVLGIKSTEYVIERCFTWSSVLCVATLADCRPVRRADRDCPGFEPYMVANETRFAWVFSELRPLDPILCKPPRGAQTWFHLPTEVEVAIDEQA